ncbi:MAG: uracil-DNA glycosylase [Anaerolineae bacterium]|nr:uracil-DNA glycosylase [Anaerolineae bacterium]MDQ7033403.1 uracil-DNA glycosylase [Anaerolineae bacterium]
MVTKVGQLSAVHTEIYTCTLCGLHSGRTRTVPGAGNPNAEILFIGEAPGYYEDQQGLPFVGKSGQYLDELLKQIGLARDDVFIANVVKCRPPDNRDPLADEMAACNPYIRRQIDIIDPLVIATLGRYSMGMFFPNARISTIHGQAKYGTVRAYYPFFHPAAVLRDSNLRPVMESDFARLLTVVEEVKRRRANDEMSATASDDANPPTEIDPESPKQMGLFD